MLVASGASSASSEVRTESPYTEPDDLVLFNADRGAPMAEITIRRGFREALRAIEIESGEQERRHLVFHGLRHFYVSLARTMLPDFVVRRLSGHRTMTMLENYSHVGGVVDLAAARKAMDGRLRGGGAG